MTAEQRDLIRQAIDATVRERVAPVYDSDVCAGCGCELDRYSAGCRTCMNRHYRRNRRAAGWPGTVVNVHGVSGYERGCRCDACRLANNERARNQRRRRLTPLQQAVSA